MKPDLVDRSALLVERAAGLGVDLGSGEARRLIALLGAVADQPQNLTRITDPDDAVERHLLDSLSGLLVPSLREAPRILDLGSGAGFPGLPLAVARPDAIVTLVESERSKAGWLRVAARDLPNVEVVGERSEDLARRERGAWPVVVARAVAPLPVLLELAAPLLAEGGTLVAWRARRHPEEERRAALAAAALALAPGPVHSVPLAGPGARHLHEYRRAGIVPGRFPRRPGRAAKRPLA